MRFLVVLYPLLLAERMSAQRPFAIRGGHFYATQNVVSVVCPAALWWRWPESGLAGVRRQEPSGNPEELAFGEGNPQRPVGCLPEIVSCRIAAFHTPQQRAVFAHGGNLPEPPGDIDHTVAHTGRAGVVFVSPSQISAPCFAVGVRRRVHGRQLAVHRLVIELPSVTAEARRFARFAAVVAP